MTIKMNKGDYILISIILVLILGVVWLFSSLINDNKEWNDKKYRISGNVIEKSLPINGYRTKRGDHVESEPHVVVYSDSLKRNVDIKVTWNCYVNMYINKKVTFFLSKRELTQ